MMDLMLNNKKLKLTGDGDDKIVLYPKDWVWSSKLNWRI